ncbi:hypothetical protein KSS87_014915 [Heliosperma pusillum]|nr:hypothetical protein KSS87_014915 [Heliosperma pusillum]
MEASPFKSDCLKGKVALLTGGGSGIGLEISTQLGKHGASIGIMGRRKLVLDSAVSSLSSLAIPAIGFEGDVRKADDARRVVESTYNHYGRIDILVNAAAGNFLVSAEDLSPNGFRTAAQQEWNPVINGGCEVWLLLPVVPLARVITRMIQHGSNQVAFGLRLRMVYGFNKNAQKELLKFGELRAVLLPEGLYEYCRFVVMMSTDSGRRKKCKYFNMWSKAPELQKGVMTRWLTRVDCTRMFQVVAKRIIGPLKTLNGGLFSDFGKSAGMAYKKKGGGGVSQLCRPVSDVEQGLFGLYWLMSGAANYGYYTWDWSFKEGHWTIVTPESCNCCSQLSSRIEFKEGHVIIAVRESFLDIDSVGTFTMCHAALKYLKTRGVGRASSGGGVILNISATLHYTASWYQIHVSAAKAAVDATTRNLALEWGTDYDIRVNGIAPGPIGDTPGMRKLAPEEIQSKANDYMPLYKLGDKWDIAMAAVYLASDAGKYVNGAVLPVDGGLWLSRPRHLAKDAVRQMSRVVEKKTRNTPTGVPKSKL